MNINFWELYKDSLRGKDIIKLFRFDAENDDLETTGSNIFKKYYKYLGELDRENDFLNNCELILECIIHDKLFIEENENSSDYFKRLIDHIALDHSDGDDNLDLVRNINESSIIAHNYRELCSLVPEISTIVYLYGDKFFPILFRENFDILIKTFDALEIPIPDFPVKSDKRGRLLLYNELNNNIVEFGEKYNLSREETCACIYDFALMNFSEENEQLEMPEPTNVWMTGASKEDYKSYLEFPEKIHVNIWTCHENTKRGDIILMYVTAPYSCIQSVWRAETDGVYTPFSYYNSRTRTTGGITFPHITLKELLEDPYFSKVSIVRKKFQGVNGVNFSTKDYKELQRLLRDKGFDTSVMPQLYNPNLEHIIELKNENDVEEKLLIPLIKKLGYSERDWSRQLSQKAGRSEKAIPDFVFLPTGEKHFQNAPMIIEAKFNMSSNIERSKCFTQALSYARMMQSSTLGICDKERLIIYKVKNGHFDRLKPVFEKQWQNINDEDTFRQLKLLIGKDFIK